MRPRGFTVIELLVVMAAIGLLLGITVPRYIAHLDHARETVLRQNLRGLREAIDQFYADQGRYPASLQELVDKRYLRALPEDPITQRTDSWTVVAPNGQAGTGAVFDVHSGAPGQAIDGSTYASW
jgi:general secretion pathway protein G